jgi:fatty-acyl-CoA synthase
MILNKDSNVLIGDVYAFCKNKIAHYKIPKYVKFLESFPTTVTGKQQKFKMREDLVKEQKNHPERFHNYQIRHH